MAATTIRRSVINTEVSNPYRDLFDSRGQTALLSVIFSHCCSPATTTLAGDFTINPALLIDGVGAISNHGNKNGH